MKLRYKWDEKKATTDLTLIDFQKNFNYTIFLLTVNADVLEIIAFPFSARTIFP